MKELQLRALALGLRKDAPLELVESAESSVSKLKASAKFSPKTINEDARTVDVVFATETPVRTFSWEDGIVNEVLSMEEGHARMGRINGGAPVLDNHSRADGAAGQLGVVENARIENGVGVATLRFSKRADVEDIWNDIKDGILRGVSVGYRVHKYEVTKEDGKLPSYRATDWEPFEISLAPVQADIESQVRNNEKKIISNKNKQMNELEKRALAAGLTQNATLVEVERAEKESKERAEKAVSDASNLAVIAERLRAIDITDAVRSAGLPAEKADKMIKDGISIDEARKLVINALAETNAEINGNNRSTAKIGNDQSDKIRKGIEDAVYHRANPTEQLSEEGKQFRGLNMLDMGRRCLELAGVNTSGMSQREVAQSAMNLSERGYMSTSDFPNVLASTVNRSLRRAYSLWTPTFKQFSQRGTFKDFRTKSVIQLGDVAKLRLVIEGGEYEYGALPEASENYKANKYGLIIPITSEAMINDDLSAFNRIPTSIANKALQVQSDVVFSFFTGVGPLMGDGIALFDAATHKNYTSTGTAITPASLQVGRIAIRTQKDVNGVDAMNLVPKYLLVGPLQEAAAFQYTSSQYVPTKNADVNPVYNTQLTVIVDPRITDLSWYLIADPAMIDTIEYSFLEGEEEVFTEKRMGWEVDGMEIKARMVFNAKPIDYRGLYKNNGA